MKLQLWSDIDGEPEDLLAEIDVDDETWSDATTYDSVARRLIQRVNSRTARIVQESIDKTERQLNELNEQKMQLIQRVTDCIEQMAICNEHLRQLREDMP